MTKGKLAAIAAIDEKAARVANRTLQKVHKKLGFIPR